MSDATLASVLDRLPLAEGGSGWVAPTSASDVAAVMAAATREGASIKVVGAGTHQGYGYPVTADVVVATTGLAGVVAWEPEDLTLTVRAGTTLGEVDQLLAGGRQTAVLPEDAATATAGGVIAAGLSGWRRLRYGPIRDRVIEVEVVTGDGRIVHAGGRVVKNVTGYDIARLVTGSFGALGVIVSASFKLWPRPSSTATVIVDEPGKAKAAFRPLAVLEERDRTRVYLGGTEREVAGEAAVLGGERIDGLQWPQSGSGSHRLVMRVPPAELSHALFEVRAALPGATFIAAHGVGEITIDGDSPNVEAVNGLRAHAELRGGSLVIAEAPDSFRAEVDPWGTPPPSLELQRRVKAAFDPFGVCNPGRLPGRL